MQRGAERRTRQLIRARLADLVASFGPARLSPGRGGLIAVSAVAVVVLVLVGGWVLASRPRPVAAATVQPGPELAGPATHSGPPATAPPGAALVGPGSGAPAGSAGSAASVASAGSGASAVVVDVAGKVHHPGVYRLQPGARVTDAVAAAGGMLPGVDPVTVNLARRLVDGEQIVVGAVAAASDAPPAGDASAGSASVGGGPAGPVDLNTATAAQLDALPGVGPVLAQRIVDWRTQHGRFDSVDQLNDVSGIGDAKFADLKSLVSVS